MKTSFTQSTGARGGPVRPKATPGETLVVGERTLALTSLDRVLYPETGFTKRALVDYYRAIAEAILPHLADRPLTLGRFPEGVHRAGFAQTEVPGRPEWVRAERLALANGKVKDFVVAEEAATLAWLAQMGTLELHVFPTRAPELETPTSIVFDLDPGEGASIVECATVATMLRARLAERGHEALLKTSGSLGLHVIVPLRERRTFAETRGLAHELARSVMAERPELVTDVMAREARVGRVLVDIRQNAARLSMVAPYSLRATPRPSVSTPLAWDELEGVRHPDQLSFGPDEVLARFAERGDLFRAR